MGIKNWSKIELKELCYKIGDGLHGTPRYDIDTNIFFINGNNLKNGKIEITSNTNSVSLEEYKKNFIELNKNTLLLSINGTLGSMAFYNNKKLMLGKSVAYLNFKEDINHFYYYFFQLKDIQSFFYNIATGSTIKNLSLKSIQDFKVPVPLKNEMNMIAKVLSTLDKKIELNNQINQNLEAMAKTLYDYWFVQFDFPNANGKPYKSSGGKMVYSEELKREIPEGWEVQYLIDFIDKNKSGDWGKEIKEGNYTKRVSCIRGADFYALNGKGEIKTPTRYILEKNTHKILNDSDVIIEISGGSPTQSTGRLTFITKSTLNRFDNPIICSNFCRALSLKDKDNLYYFANTWNMLYDNNVMFGWEGKTSGLKNLLLKNMLESVQVVVPNCDLNKKFYGLLDSFQKIKQTNLQETQKLTQLRDWLLPMLMNGQVTVGRGILTPTV